MQRAKNTLEILSWNSCQYSWKRKRRKLVEELAVLSGDLLVLLQEVKTWEDDVVGNFRVLSELGKDCAILIPKSWQTEIGDIIHGEYFTMALVGNLACGSVHFPHDRGKQELWTKMLGEVEQKLDAWSSNGKMKYIILGVDLNFTLPAEFDQITGSLVLPRVARHPDRLQEIVRFLSEHKLRAINTFVSTEGADAPMFTWHNKRFTQKSQIDYIFMSDNIESDVAVRTDTKLKSDHYPLMGTAKLQVPMFHQKRRSSSWKGWTLKSDRKQYHMDLLRRCGLEEGIPNKNLGETMMRMSLESIEKAVKTAVMNTEFDTGSSNLHSSRQIPDDIKALKVGTWLLDGETRKAARKEFLKKRAQWKCSQKISNLRAASEYKKRLLTFLPPMEMIVEGAATRDRALWQQGLTDFISKRYYVREEGQTEFKNKLIAIRSTVNARRLDGIPMANIRLHDVIFARAVISTNTAGGKDGIVGEIWRDLPYCMIIVLWVLFRLKAEYGLGKVSDAWRVWELVGLPKMKCPNSFDEFRYICKSPVLQKWYLKSIVNAAQRYRKPSIVQTYGFRKGRGPMLITELVRHLLFLSHEWGARVFVGSFDIKTAFDSMKHALMFKSMVARGIPEQMAVALVWELCDVKADVEIFGVTATKDVEINSGGRQGGTETTWCWNILLEFIMEDIVKTWNDLKMGFEFDGKGLVNHAIWADNVYLFASSGHELESMFKMLTETIYKNDLKWKAAELCFINGTNDGDFGDIEVHTPDGMMILKNMSEIKVLGVLIDQRGSADGSIDFNLARADGAYGSIAKLLKDKKVPVEERLRAWCRGPVGSALYGAGGWALSKHNIHKLRRWEFNHIRAFLKMKRTSDEEGHCEFNRRTNRRIYELFVKYAMDPIYVKVAKRMFNWAKTWWTFTLDDLSRPLFDYMNCRPAAEWENTRAENAEWDHKNLTGWRHQHSGRRLQWEDGLNSALQDWRTCLEEDPEKWHTHRRQFLKNITTEFDLKTEGLKGFEENLYKNTPAAGRKKRKQSSSDKDKRQDAHLACEQWAFAKSIGSDLYCTAEQDSRWERANTFEFIADNETLVEIVAGLAEPENTNMDTIAELIGDISEAIVGYNWGPRSVNGCPVRWLRREFNKEADFIANHCMDTQEDFNYVNVEFVKQHWDEITNVQCWSDGGHRPDQAIASYGWVIKGWVDDQGPRILAVGGKFLRRNATSSLEVEALGMRKAAETFLNILKKNLPEC